MNTRRRSKRHRVPDAIFELRDQYVAVAGPPVSVTVERDHDSRKNDHVWITIEAGKFGRMQIALSTMSRQSRAAGFDPRMRVGIQTGSWDELPAPGIRRTDGLDYRTIEAITPIPFHVFEREPLEELLTEKSRRATFVEAWGEFYVRAHIGIHQVHSRRASFAVTRDLIGQDGAVRFYFREPNKTEMLLFKFAGQP
ncbi:MAG TPA: hypothetical protein VJ719_03815 [Chthoniobacterales bacterium]|nr:hypothetical protein [Chthoniobacterales bacterium]